MTTDAAPPEMEMLRAMFARVHREPFTMADIEQAVTLTDVIVHSQWYWMTHPSPAHEMIPMTQYVINRIDELRL